MGPEPSIGSTSYSERTRSPTKSASPTSPAMNSRRRILDAFNDCEEAVGALLEPARSLDLLSRR